MPFTVPYAPQERYAPNGRLVDLIRLQGQDAARAAEIRGQQQAQLWGGVGNTIGNVANTVLQATDPQRKVEAARAQMVQGQVADANALRAGQGKVDAMMAGDQLPAGDTGPRQESYLTDDGLYDIPKLNKSLAAAWIGHLAPELLKHAEDLNASITTAQQHDQQAAQSKAIMLGYMASGALKLHQAVGMPLDGAIEFVARPGLAAKQIKPEELAGFKAQIGQLPPDQQVGALQQIMDHAAEIAPKKSLSKDAIETDIFGRTAASNIVPDKKPDYTINGQRFNGATNQPIGNQVAPIAAPAPAQTHTMRLKGVGDVPVDYVPNKDGSGGKWMYQGKDVTGQLTAIPSAAITIHNDQAKGLNLPSWATDASRPVGPEANTPDPSIKMTPNGLHQAAQTFIASGQYPPTGRGSDPIAVAQREAITSKVGAIAADAGMDVPTLRAFYRSNAASLGQQQKAFDAASVAISKADRDVDLLEKVLPKIGDTGSPLFNKPLRSFEKDVAGNEDMSEFVTRLRSVQNEYTRILNASLTGSGGGVMSDSARHETDQLLDPKATVGQMLRSIAALKSEGGNRLLSQGEQIQRIQKRMQGGPQGATNTPTTTPIKVGGFTVVVK